MYLDTWYWDMGTLDTPYMYLGLGTGDKYLGLV